MEKTKFNPSEHLTDIKGKPYLQVAWRLVWFREEHPEWGIETEIVERGDGWALAKATIKDDKGKVLATAHKAETKVGFFDYLEKAETGACGRALAMCGYGTQFAPELDEGDRLADAPIRTTEEVVAEPVTTGAMLATEKQKKFIFANGKSLGLEEEQTKDTAKKIAGIDSFSKLTVTQAREVIERQLKALASRNTDVKDDPTKDFGGELPEDVSADSVPF